MTKKYPWQLSTWSRGHEDREFGYPQPTLPSHVQRSPSFNPRRVYRVYHVCGEGHISLVERPQIEEPLQDERPLEIPQVRAMFAAVGGTAAGKSYLLVRTLAQPLIPRAIRPGRVPGYRTALTYRTPPSDWVENIPGNELLWEYDKGRSNNEQIPNTTVDRLLPTELLGDLLTSNLEFEEEDQTLTSVIKEIHKKLPNTTDDTPDPESWGRRIRQPVVLRSQFEQTGGERRRGPLSWIGITDLAGESFAAPDADNPHEDGAGGQGEFLQHFDGLLWVVDPAADPRITELAAKSRRDPAVVRNILSASVRVAHGEDPTAVQGTRERNQNWVAENVERLLRSDGTTSLMHVVVTKCDLIRAALSACDGFDQLFADKSVEYGVAAYIEHVLDRTGSVDAGTSPVIASPELRRLLTELHRIGTGRRNKVVDECASILTEHYGNADRFWRLVHGPGDATDVLDLSPADGALPRDLIVPAPDVHLVASLQPDQADVLQVRDFVMSALGCGIVHALGFDVTVLKLFERGGCDTRFHLCTPLVELPTQAEPGVSGFGPAEPGAKFPVRNDASAGLTHLLLAILRVARR
ncbi:MAG: hypothetical protein AB7L91_18100 [Dehalococcoidia bacterium]